MRHTGCSENDGAGERHALALAAGELAGLAREIGRKPRQFGDFPHARVPLGARHAPHFEAEDDVLRDRQDAGTRRRTGTPWRCAGLWRAAGDVTSLDLDAPGGRLLEPGDQTQRGRLAATGRAEQHAERASLDRKRHVVDRGAVAEILDEMFDRDARQMPVPPTRPARRHPIEGARAVLPRIILARPARLGNTSSR